MPRRLLPLALLLAGCNLAGNPTRLQPPLNAIHHRQLPDPIEQAEAEQEVQKTWDRAWEQFQRELAARRPTPPAAAVVSKTPRESPSRRYSRRAPRMVAWAVSGARISPHPSHRQLRGRWGRTGPSPTATATRVTATLTRAAATLPHPIATLASATAKRLVEVPPDDEVGGMISGPTAVIGPSSRSTISSGSSSAPVLFSSDIGNGRNKRKNKGKRAVAGQVFFPEEFEGSAPQNPGVSTISSD